jgi:nucleotide-binding universal stress UspA family protein
MAVMPIVAGVDGSQESMRAAQWAAAAAQRRRAPLQIVSAAAAPPRMRAPGSDLRTGADELCGESARALSEAVTRSAEVSSRLVIDASLLIGPPSAGSSMRCSATLAVR